MTRDQLDRMSDAVMHWPGQERCTLFQFRSLRTDDLEVMMVVDGQMGTLRFMGTQTDKAIHDTLDMAERTLKSVDASTHDGFSIVIPSKN